MDTDNAIIVNTAGKRCPMPLMETRRALSKAGQRPIIVWATDLSFEIDVQAAADIEQTGRSIKVSRQTLPPEMATSRAAAGADALRVELIAEG